MAKRHSAASAKRRGRAPAIKYSQRVVALLSQRDDLMNEIVAARIGVMAHSPLVRNAVTLLTRYWARADWPSREEFCAVGPVALELGKNSIGHGTIEGIQNRPA